MCASFENNIHEPNFVTLREVSPGEISNEFSLQAYVKMYIYT